LPRGLAAGQSSTDYVNRSNIMARHALTIATQRSKTDCLLAVGVVLGLTGCSRGQASPEADVPSAEKAWVAAACTPVAPDFSTWTRSQVGGVTIASPPGYTVLQGDPGVLALRGPARRSNLGIQFLRSSEARKTFDSYYYRQQRQRNVCRANLSGYPADVVAWYERGQYGLVAFWEASWGGEDAEKWLMVFLTSSRLEEAIELRAVLRTMRPVGTDQ
jgi:hypothetical protein